MEQKLVEKANEVNQSIEELKQLWMDYVKQQGEVDLHGRYITMCDGSGERMQKMTYYDGVVYIVDQFGCQYNFTTDTSFETLVDLHDTVLVRKLSSEE